MKTSRHSPQPNLDVVGQVTALLGAGGVSRLKSVSRARVTGQTLDIFEGSGIGLEVYAMAGGRGYPLPGLLRFALDVALLADGSRYLGVGRDLVRARHDPVVQLLALGLELEGVTGVTGETVVGPLQLVDQEIGPGIRTDEDLAAGHEDVAAGAEIVVMHDVVMGLEPSGEHQKQHRRHRCTERQLDPAVSGDQPVANPFPSSPYQQEDHEREQRAEHDPADHHPAGALEDPLDYRDEGIGQR